jgi:DNA-binding winged helix-turn-helix (wHTH) protein
MSEKTQDFWELGPFIIDVAALRLTQDGERVKVGLRCLSVLVALLEAEGRPVSREQLILRGWGTPNVDGSNLTHCITELRRLLARGFGERAAIETVPRFGYRLAVPARKPAPDFMAAPAPASAGPQKSAPPRISGWAMQTAAVLAVLVICSTTAFLAWSRVQDGRQSDDLYRQGLHLLRQRNAKSIPQAADLFRRGIQTYPQDGRFHAGLAETMVLQRSLNHDLALDAARKAVSLAPESSHARAVLGFTLYSRFYDWENAERQLRAALTLSPEDVQAMLWLTLLHVGRNQLAQAEAQINHAIRIEPNSPNLHSARAGVYYATGRYDACIQESDLAVSLQPDFAMAHAWRAKCAMAANRTIQFIDAMTRARAVWYSADEAWRQREHEELLASYRRGGMNAVHRKLLSYSEDKGAGLVAFDQAISHAALGERERALDLLEEAFGRRSRDMIFLQIVPAFQPLHETGRWKRLLTAMNLKPRAN